MDRQVQLAREQLQLYLLDEDAQTHSDQGSGGVGVALGTDRVDLEMQFRIEGPEISQHQLGLAQGQGAPPSTHLDDVTGRQGPGPGYGWAGADLKCDLYYLGPARPG